MYICFMPAWHADHDLPQWLASQRDVLPTRLPLRLLLPQRMAFSLFVVTNSYAYIYASVASRLQLAVVVSIARRHPSRQAPFSLIIVCHDFFFFFFSCMYLMQVWLANCDLQQWLASQRVVLCTRPPLSFHLLHSSS